MLLLKMKSVIGDVNDLVVERSELIECIAIALLTRKNLFILGDTGQAKSYAINEFRKRITGAKQFERLVSKQTDEEQLFGRIDLSSLIPGNVPRDVMVNDYACSSSLTSLESHYNQYLKYGDAAILEKMQETLGQLNIIRSTLAALHQSEPQMITAGKIPDSHIVFLDELFKANDGILNSLLTALNERKYTNEGQTIDIPTISFMSASNEIPNFNDPAEKILKPLYDRFDIKVVTQYVEDRQARLNTLFYKQNQSSCTTSNVITLDELIQMQDEVRRVSIPDTVNELMDDILCELRKVGVHISDRKYFNYYPIAQAKAWLSGCSEVNALHLMALKNYLWTTPDEITTIEQTLTRMCQNPLQDKLDNIRGMAVDSLDELKANKENKRSFAKFREEFVHLYDMLTELTDRAVSDSEKIQIDDFLKSLEDMSREAHTLMGFTYTGLAEIKALQ